MCLTCRFVSSAASVSTSILRLAGDMSAMPKVVYLASRKGLWVGWEIILLFPVWICSMLYSTALFARARIPYNSCNYCFCELLANGKNIWDREMSRVQEMLCFHPAGRLEASLAFVPAIFSGCSYPRNTPVPCGSRGKPWPTSFCFELHFILIFV